MRRDFGPMLPPSTRANDRVPRFSRFDLADSVRFVRFNMAKPSHSAKLRAGLRSEATWSAAARAAVQAGPISRAGRPSRGEDVESSGVEGSGTRWAGLPIVGSLPGPSPGKRRGRGDLMRVAPLYVGLDSLTMRKV